MILVDTSVWIDHLRAGDSELKDLLRSDQVLIHRFVIGELACGRLRARDAVLSLLHSLPAARVASDEEALFLVAARNLYGRGLGWIDVHLLASALISNARLWTRDRRLAEAARDAKLLHDRR